MAPEIDGFEQLTEVGRGGFGIVYRAWQPAFGRFVALKVLSGAHLDASTARRVGSEALAMGSLSGHPNILEVFGSGSAADGSPYLVMPFLPGGSLGDRLTAGGALAWTDAVAIGVKLAGALHTAHLSGILHRDIKPDNVFISGFGEPQLGDFGIARIAGATNTAAGSVSATILYAAPEILSGGQPTAASDTYSLAATVYAALAGRPAFASSGADETPLAGLIAQVVGGEPARLSGSVPDPVWGVIRRGMEKDPAARPASAAAFGRELQAAQRQLRTGVTAMTIPEQDAGSPLETVLLDIPLPATPSRDAESTAHLGPGRQFPEAPGRSSDERGPSGRKRWPLVVGVGVLLLLVAAAGTAALLSRDSGESADSQDPIATSTSATSTTIPTTTSIPATTTTALTAERPTEAITIFESAIDAQTPFFNDLGVLVNSTGPSIESPEDEAAYLGAWYSLADWCVDNGQGRTGVCYDLAAEYLTSLFDRDPRTVNDETWGSPGAIGGVIDSGYSVAQQYLGLEPGFADLLDRPGIDLLCEPSCTAIID